MCGSGIILDVARELGRCALGYDLRPIRPDIFRANARKLPLENGAVGNSAGWLFRTGGK